MTWKRTIWKVVGVAAVVGVSRPAAAIDIVFDFRFDSGYISGNPEAVDALQQAAAFFAPLGDSLSAIVPGTVYNPGTQFEFQDQWTATLTNPSTDEEVSVDNLTIPQDSIYVFVGSQDLSGPTLGGAAGGGYSVSGIQDFVEAVGTRGQQNISGPAATDYATWGGRFAIDTLDDEGQPRNWNWNANLLPQPDQVDFLSAAIHEITHLLGFAFIRDMSGNPDNSFSALADVANKQFWGADSQEVFGGPVPLETLAGNQPSHWADDVTSVRLDGAVAQSALMTRSLMPGKRELATLLDYAALADIGWEVPASILDVPVLLGDYNHNGVVDAADYTAWRDGLGSVYTVDEYQVWRDEFGAHTAAGDAIAMAVPEPALGALLGVAATLLWGRRRPGTAGGYAAWRLGSAWPV
jgi:hypothetical protein